MDQPQQEKVPRTKRLIKRIAELHSLGIGDTEIASTINKEMGMDINNNIVNRIISRGVTITGTFLKTDKKTSEYYKEIVNELISKVKENIAILDRTREIISERMENLKEDMPESQLMNYIKQINAQIRTQNDSIRTMSENLKRMEAQSTEVKVSASQQVQQTLEMLENLESQGYITINPEYFKSELYKEFAKEDEEEFEELKDEEPKEEE